MDVMMRSFKEGMSSWFTPEARQRAHEYLLSVGYTEDQLKPIEWPDDAVSAHRDHVGQPWRFTTKGDIRRCRQDRAKEILRYKREEGATKIRPLYVWVFHCPGIGGDMVGALGHEGIRGVRSDGLMSGWYAYLIGQGVSIALNFRGHYKKMIDRLMELFPLVKATTLFDGPDFDEWMRAFVERYPKGLWCDVPQGKAVVRAEVDGDSVIRILEVGQWPAKRKAV